MNRKLDREIAEKIFGLEVVHTRTKRHEYYSIGDADWGDDRGEMYLSNSLPSYSSDITSAMEIVEKIPLRFCIIKESDHSNERRYKCWFTREDGESGFPVSYSNSMAEAICLAALKTVDKLEK